MHEAIVAASFVEDMAQVYSDSVYQHIRRLLATLEESDFGLHKAPTVLVERFGPRLRTIIVSSFYLFYRVSEDDSRIEVLSLVYARRDLGRWSRTA